MNRDFAGALLLYIHSAPRFPCCVTLGPFGEAEECNGEGKWSYLLKAPSWIPLLPWEDGLSSQFINLREERRDLLG